ncbi:MAG: CHAT domain-containing tetratricopeptide repeat protein [Candidatus Aminicenantales bacterium]
MYKIIFSFVLFSFLSGPVIGYENSQLSFSLKKKIFVGEILMKEGKYQKAIARFEDALNLAQELKLKIDEVYILKQMGILYWNIGGMGKSSSFYEKALNISKSLALKNEEQECSSALEIIRLYLKGKDFRSLSQYRLSINYFIEAIRLSREIKSPNHEAKCLRQMSLNYWDMEEIEKFFRFNSQAQLLANKIQNRREEGICLNNLGLCYWKRNDYSNALRYFHLALEISEGENHIENISDCLANLSLIYFDFGDYDKTLGYLMRVLKIDNDLNDIFNIAIDNNNIGNAYLKKGLVTQVESNFLEAIKSFNNSLELAKQIKNKKIESIILNNIGEVFYAQKEFKIALINYSKSLDLAYEIRYNELISRLQSNIGNVYLALKQPQKAISHLLKAIDIAFEINDSKILWESYYNLGQCYEANEQYYEAKMYYTKSIEIIDKIRSQINIDIFKTGYSRDKSIVYESIINLLWKINKESNSCKEDIFYFIEKSKARAFLESLLEAKVDIMQSLDQQQRHEMNDVSNKIGKIFYEVAKPNSNTQYKQELKDRLSQEEDKYMRLLSRIRTENPALAGLISPKTCQLEQIQTKILNEKTAMIEYFLGTQQSYMLFITKYKYEIFILPSRRIIENSIRAYTKYLSSPLAEVNGSIAAEPIYKELLFPLEREELPNIEKLIIVPDGILYYLPFEALALKTKKRVIDYLVDKYQVSYAPSASVLSFLCDKKEKIESFKGLLAIGGPIYRYNKEMNEKSKEGKYYLAEIYLNQGFSFSEIPYSKYEIEAISKYFPKNQRDIFIGKEAREEVLKNRQYNNYQIIHFACHSFLDERFPIRSALVLSSDDDREEDGFLQVWELYNLKLNSNLVVLSACQTGKGQMENGEGILGLPRIFFYSGARSVLSTLWAINDKVTANFMNVYYSFLEKGNSKAQALQLAKQSMINSKYSHPYYWAGYILNGESDSTIKFR